MKGLFLICSIFTAGMDTADLNGSLTFLGVEGVPIHFVGVSGKYTYQLVGV